MRPRISSFALGLSLTAALVLTSTARAQAPASYYYPTQGYYWTTGGMVYVPAPGYYLNVPAAAPTPEVSRSYVTVPRSGGRRGTSYGSTPYYQAGGSGGTPHYLHGRGYDTAGHR